MYTPRTHLFIFFLCTRANHIERDTYTQLLLSTPRTHTHTHRLLDTRFTNKKKQNKKVKK